MTILLPGEKADTHQLKLEKSGGWIRLLLDGETIFHLYEEDGESHVYMRNIRMVFPSAVKGEVRDNQ